MLLVAAWSIAQESLRPPVREARQDTTTSVGWLKALAQGFGIGDITEADLGSLEIVDHSAPGSGAPRCPAFAGEGHHLVAPFHQLAHHKTTDVAGGSEHHHPHLFGDGCGSHDAEPWCSGLDNWAKLGAVARLGTMTPTQPKRLMPWLGRHPLRTVLRLAAAVVGLGATGWLLSTVWPEPDQVARTEPVAADNPTNLAPLPLGPVTLLVVGIDADQTNDPVNNAAPRGRANADAVMVVQIDAQQPLRVLQVPVELALQLPGQTTPVKLGSLWQTGGVALLSDAIRELVGLPARSAPALRGDAPAACCGPSWTASGTST